MASGKPIVSMLNGEGNRLVEEAKCGLTAPSGDYRKLAENVITLYHSNRDQLIQMGENGLLYYKQHFDKKTVVDTLLKVMK